MDPSWRLRWRVAEEARIRGFAAPALAGCALQRDGTKDPELGTRYRHRQGGGSRMRRSKMTGREPPHRQPAPFRPLSGQYTKRDGLLDQPTEVVGVAGLRPRYVAQLANHVAGNLGRYRLGIGCTINGDVDDHVLRPHGRPCSRETGREHDAARAQTRRGSRTGPWNSLASRSASRSSVALNRPAPSLKPLRWGRGIVQPSHDGARVHHHAVGGSGFLHDASLMKGAGPRPVVIVTAQSGSFAQQDVVLHWTPGGSCFGQINYGRGLVEERPPALPRARFLGARPERASSDLCLARNSRPVPATPLALRDSAESSAYGC